MPTTNMTGSLLLVLRGNEKSPKMPLILVLVGVTTNKAGFAGQGRACNKNGKNNDDASHIKPGKQKPEVILA